MYLMVTNYVFYSKRTGLLSAVTIFSGVLNVGLLLLLVESQGLAGAAIAYSIAMGVRFLLTWWVAQRRVPDAMAVFSSQERMMLTKSSMLVTGGTGSFGNTFVPMTLERYDPKRLVIFSRDEMKQWEMAKKFGHDPRVRFFIGDVRDRDRLYRALDGIDYVVHAAATKIVPLQSTTPLNA